MRKAAPKKTKAQTASPSPGDWRQKMIERIRALIRDADPDAVEEAKWPKVSNPAGVPTWSHDGIICTGETYKDKIKLTFAQGAALKDPKRPFNAGLDGGTRRAIDIHEGDKVDEKALVTLIREAVALNTAKKPVRRKRRTGVRVD